MTARIQTAIAQARRANKAARSRILDCAVSCERQLRFAFQAGEAPEAAQCRAYAAQRSLEAFEWAHDVLVRS